ncbi:MAG: hypothetical protein FP825_08250 [Hyphomonas sp.]|uniref:hypothetical protein n=1 Tax=Hyphomonas sp. TaxID=87 RepID=UPI001830B7FA|nr:hypothetical protein [Hyphomonas sp.]MBA3068455.1 hypothetical protein [Hyphomonas sp.]MBU4060678.1 hypothetical protein [Alphaproteobacteria bacterium]MBU4164662.1 hypothetical protein [Alphaproteobacteria bacterium]
MTGKAARKDAQVPPCAYISSPNFPTDFAQSYAAPGALRPGTLAARLFKPSARLAAALAPETCAVPAPAPAQTASSVHVLSGAVQFDTS